jgi:hypothetical protein
VAQITSATHSKDLNLKCKSENFLLRKGKGNASNDGFVLYVVRGSGDFIKVIEGFFKDNDLS